MFLCIFHYTSFVYAVSLFNACICLYLHCSVYVFALHLLLYWQCHVNVSVQIVKRLGHYKILKPYSNFLVKGELVPPDAFSRESLEIIVKVNNLIKVVYHLVYCFLHLHTTYSHQLLNVFHFIWKTSNVP